MSWIIYKGEPFQTEAAEVKDEAMTKPYPFAYFRMDDGEIVNEYSPVSSTRAVMYPYPLSYWRQSKYVNEGYPYHEMFKGIEYVEPVQRYDVLRINENVRVISPPHGLDKTFPITKMEIPLDKPEETKYTLNEDIKTSLTEVMAETNMETWREIQSQPTLTTMLASAKKNATELIKSASGGYVTLKRNDNGVITEILISDEADYTVAKRIWRWNVNGLGYSNTGYNGEFGLAMTMDGSIVADRITTGSMYADRIRGGILKMGGIDNVNGVIQVLDGDANEVVLMNQNGAIIRGTIENENPDTGRRIKVTQGTITTYDDSIEYNHQVAQINMTNLYEGREEGGIDLWADGLVVRTEWLGVAQHKDSVAWATKPTGKISVVTDVKLTSDGKLNVTKKDLLFMKGFCVNNLDMEYWNPENE